MVNRILKYCNFILLGLIVSGLYSCSEDLEYSGLKPWSQDNLHLIFNIPDEEDVVITRASEEGSSQENKINNLSLLIFDSSNKLVKIEHPEFTQSGKKVELDLVLTSSEKSGFLYAVANARDEVDNNLSVNSSTLSDAKQVVIKTTLDNTVPTTGFPMSGSASLASASNQVSVNLSRVVSKITVESSGTLKGYTINRFGLAKANKGVRLGATDSGSSNDNLFYLGEGVETEWQTSSPLTRYFYPVAAYDASLNINGAFILLRALNTATNTNSWYRLNLRDDNTKNPVDILPNHHYSIIITSITGDGHATYAEAAGNITGDEGITYEIHDHAANVYSMVTDGIRELGVTESFQWDTSLTAGVQTTFTVKWYSHNTGEEATEPSLTLTSGEEWLSLNKTGGLVGTTDETSGNQDTDHPGTRKKYTLTIKENPTYIGPALIKVEWMGLSREIEISLDLNADHEALCNVSLKIYEGSTLRYDISNYWKFLDGTDTNYKLFGVSEAANNGNARNEGFHFAMPYGTDSKWTYVYTIDFNSSIYDTGAKIIGVELPDDNELVSFDDTPSETNKLSSLTFRYSGGVTTDYQLSSVTFILEDTSQQSHTHSFPIYHTGFFHNHSAGDGVNVEDGFYYYEVVSLGGSHWLDRNLAAKSKGMYIEANDGSTQFGDIDAKGGYFTVAQAGGIVNEKPVDPTMQPGVCPPGYHVPSKTEWDKLKNSSDFITSQRRTNTGEVYYTSEYLTENTHIDAIYFQKSRYENAGVSSGEAAAGYYWTATRSDGLEKDEIGQWLKVFNIKGSSSSYINGDIRGHKMSVRCAYGNTAETDQQYTVGFNVRGATHVFIFTKDSKTPAYAFPGKSITGADGTGEWMSFSYSSTYKATELMVLFAYVGGDGDVTLYTKNGSTFDSKFGTYDLDDAINNKAWEVQNGYYYDFKFDSDVYSSSKPNVTSSKPTDPAIENTYRFYWSTSIGLNGVHLWLDNNGAITTLTSSTFGNSASNLTDISGYYGIEFKTSKKGVFSYILFQGKNDTSNKTIDYYNKGDIQYFKQIGNIYYAYIDNLGDNLNYNKPESVVTTSTYRIYWKTTFGEGLWLWGWTSNDFMTDYTNGTNGVEALHSGYNYADFNMIDTSGNLNYKFNKTCENSGHDHFGGTTSNFDLVDGMYVGYIDSDGSSIKNGYPPIDLYLKLGTGFSTEEKNRFYVTKTNNLFKTKAVTVNQNQEFKIADASWSDNANFGKDKNNVTASGGSAQLLNKSQSNVTYTGSQYNGIISFDWSTTTVYFYDK